MHVRAPAQVAAFTNNEEEAVGLTKMMPFLLQDKLVELGAHYECGENWKPFAVRAGNLVTGQNPGSSQRVAELMLEALKEKPVNA